MSRFQSSLLGLAMAALAVFVAAPARADANDDQIIINKAKVAVDDLRSQFKQPLDSLLRRAKAVLIYPEIFKAGFIIGASGGVGVLLVRGADDSWSAPAFFGFGSGSIGLQIGASGSQVMFLIMTDGGLTKVMKDQVKLGADASIAVGPVGAGVEAASTTNLNADMYVYSKSEGLFAGGAVNGAVISASDERNREYYGGNPTARAIVIDRQFNNPGADALRNALAIGH